MLWPECLPSFLSLRVQWGSLILALLNRRGRASPLPSFLFRHANAIYPRVRGGGSIELRLPISFALYCVRNFINGVPRFFDLFLYTKRENANCDTFTDYAPYRIFSFFPLSYRHRNANPISQIALFFFFLFGMYVAKSRLARNGGGIASDKSFLVSRQIDFHPRSWW